MSDGLAKAFLLSVFGWANKCLFKAVIKMQTEQHDRAVSTGNRRGRQQVSLFAQSSINVPDPGRPRRGRETDANLLRI